MTLFNQYIELPSQSFESIESVIMPDKIYDVDSTLIHLYSVLMNHQDYSRKNKQPYYAESYDSLAYLTHSSKSTIGRKADQLIQMGLLVSIYRHKKTCIWKVNPLSEMNESTIIRRKSEKEAVADFIQSKVDNFAFQNETETSQNETIMTQNETETSQNDRVNSSNTNSNSTSLLAVNVNAEIEENNNNTSIKEETIKDEYNRSIPNENPLDNESLSVDITQCNTSSVAKATPLMSLTTPNKPEPDLQSVSNVLDGLIKQAMTSYKRTEQWYYDHVKSKLETDGYYNLSNGDRLIYRS